MTGDRFQDLWTRQLDGQQLSPEEAADLARAFIDETDLRTTLVRDAEMHDLLNTTARLARSDDDAFIRAVMTRLDAHVAAADLEPVPPPRRMLTAEGWSEPEPPPVQVGARVHSPASLTPPSSAASSISPVRRRSRRSSAAWLALAAASVAAVVVLAALFFVRPLLTSVRHHDPATIADKNGATLPTNVGPVVADSPVAVQPVVWRRGGPQGERLAPGVHELAQGTARVRTLDDLEVELVAPTLIDFADRQTLDVRRGLVRVRHSHAAPAIRLLTPLSEVKEFEGTAEVQVADEGVTEIAIENGRLTFVERFARQSPAQPVTLDSNDFDRARVYVPVREPSAGGRNDEPRELAATELLGPDHRFLGQIAVDGKVLEFGSPATFADIRRKSQVRFQQTPVEFVRKWNEMMDQLQNVGDAQTKLEVDGRRVEARNGDALFGFEMSTRVSIGAGTEGEEDEGFEGVIMVNGELRSFKSKADFEAAQKEMMKRLP
ncbi:MAG: hypothetical protein U0939_23675 [Pirellulales bacterium]